MVQKQSQTVLCSLPSLISPVSTLTQRQRQQRVSSKCSLQSDTTLTFNTRRFYCDLHFTAKIEGSSGKIGELPKVIRVMQLRERQEQDLSNSTLESGFLICLCVAYVASFSSWSIDQNPTEKSLATHYVLPILFLLFFLFFFIITNTCHHTCL